MKRICLILFIAIHSAGGGLDRYPNLVVADRGLTKSQPEGVRITYLGTNGYQFQTGRHTLLLDPYFSRAGLGAILFNAPVHPNEQQIDAALRRLAPKPDAILVTHGHIDHLFDVPPIMWRTGARLIASRTAVELAAAAGAPRASCSAVTAGTVREIDPWKITVLPATHDRVFPIGVPFSGPRATSAAPIRPNDWVCGEPLAFLIETAGRRIYIDSGGTPAVLPPPTIAPVDLAILGVALPDARERFPESVRRLRPRYILPSHQDNFFRPLDRRFAFGPLTSFRGLLRDYQREQLPGRLILLDYFQPWTLP